MFAGGEDEAVVQSVDQPSLGLFPCRHQQCSPLLSNPHRARAVCLRHTLAVFLCRRLFVKLVHIVEGNETALVSVVPHQPPVVIQLPQHTNHLVLLYRQLILLPRLVCIHCHRAPKNLNRLDIVARNQTEQLLQLQRTCQPPLGIRTALDNAQNIVLLKGELVIVRCPVLVNSLDNVAERHGAHAELPRPGRIAGLFPKMHGHCRGLADGREGGCASCIGKETICSRRRV